MTLLNDFFSITSSECDEKGGFIYHICLNSAHVIFGAHFPGNPITPGVCQIGIVEDLVSLQIGNNVHTSFISNIKYMSTLTPTEHETLDVYISPIKEVDGEFYVQSALACPDCVFTKMNLRLK